MKLSRIVLRQNGRIFKLQQFIISFDENYLMYINSWFKRNFTRLLNLARQF